MKKLNAGKKKIVAQKFSDKKQVTFKTICVGVF